MKQITTISVVATISAALGTWAAAAWIAWRPIDESIDGRLVGPRIVLPTTRCDLGTVPADGPLVAPFVIHNEGGRRLIVRREQGACCGGDEAYEDVTIVAPQSWAELVATVDAVGQWGRLEKKVTYTTNDPALPRLQLVILANVASPMPISGEGALTRTR